MCDLPEVNAATSLNYSRRSATRETQCVFSLNVFTTTGVDFLGPFNSSYGSNKTVKACGALFTCATVRAIHLKIVDGLSTESFLQALRRLADEHNLGQWYILRWCQARMKQLFQEGKKQIQYLAMLHKLKWTFLTLLSPQQGGFYESLIKQVKRSLHTSVGEQILTWNEMSTVFAEVKCLVNSRQMSYISNNPNDPQPITPNHFLLGRASPEIP